MMVNEDGAVVVADDVVPLSGEGDIVVQTLQRVGKQTSGDISIAWTAITTLSDTDLTKLRRALNERPIGRHLPRSEPYDVIETMGEQAGR